MEKRVFDLVNKRDIKKTRELIELSKLDNYQVCAWGTGKVGRTFGKEILDILNINIDYYCDTNTEKVGTFIAGKRCESVEKLFNNKEKCICFVLIGYADIESACTALVEHNVTNIVTYDDLCELPEVMEYFLPFLKKNIAVYTCITGGYDEPKEPEYISEKCDYFLISETPPNKGSIYKWIDLYDVVPKEITNPIYQSRYCKMHPHIVFPNYRYSIYVDGSITITGSLEDFIDKLGKSRIATLGGNFSKNYYAHVIRIVKMGSDTSAKVIKQVQNYFRQGLPTEIGTFVCGLLIREHNHPICKRVMDIWWEEYVNNCNRDQISFPYAIWKNGMERKDVYLICDENNLGEYFDNPYWKYTRQHKKERFLAVKGSVEGRIE